MMRQLTNFQAFLVAPLFGPLLYTIIVFLLPDKTAKSADPGLWAIAFIFLVIISYVLSAIIGYPLIKIFGENPIIIVAVSTLLGIIIYFLIMYGISGEKEFLSLKNEYVIYIILGGTFGFANSMSFCKFAGITSRSKATPKSGAL